MGLQFHGFVQAYSPRSTLVIPEGEVTGDIWNLSLLIHYVFNTYPKNELEEETLAGVIEEYPHLRSLHLL